MALRFTGAEGARVARPVDGDFTVEMWMKSTQANVGSTYWYYGAVLFFADTVTSNSNDFGFAVLNGRVALGTGNPDTTASSRTSVNTGTWVHVAGRRVMSTGVLTVLVDGVEDGQRTSPNQGTLGSNPWAFIGDQSATNYAAYAGLVDEIRVWSVARSAAEIAGDMHRRLTGNEPGLVLYLRCDEGSGNVARDSSPGHRDADLDFLGALPEWVPSDAPVD